MNPEQLMNSWSDHLFEYIVQHPQRKFEKNQHSKLFIENIMNLLNLQKFLDSKQLLVSFLTHSNKRRGFNRPSLI